MTKPTGTPPLCLVTNDRPAVSPPQPLGVSGTRVWSSIQHEFRIVDAGGIELLLQICLAADRVEAMAARINTDGELINTRTGMRPHPLLKEELAARAFISRGLQRLGVLDQNVQPIGHPTKPFGWTGPAR